MAELSRTLYKEMSDCLFSPEAVKRKEEKLAELGRQRRMMMLRASLFNMNRWG